MRQLTKDEKHIFPSYGQIQKEILKKKENEYNKKISKIINKIHAMSSQLNINEEHAKIRAEMLELSKQNQFTNEMVIQKEVLYWEKPQKYSNKQNHESLNYYLEDDKQEENNYETFLKFKKKALERDLFEEKEDQKTLEQKKQEEEQIFKKLYMSDSMNKESFKIKQVKKCCQTKRNSKENLLHVIPNMEKKPMILMGRSRRRIQEQRETHHISVNHLKKKTQKQIAKEKAQAKEQILNTYDKNKKILTQNYFNILKKLENTNIVKWRILNSSS